MKRFVLLAVCALAVVGAVYAWQTVGASGPGLPLRLVGDFPLTGNATRFDYASLVAARGIVWVAHMGDGSVEAFDVKANRVTLTIPIAPAASVRGVLAARGNVYAAAQGLGAVVVLDGASGKRIATVPAGDVDGVAYDPVTERVYVLALDPALHRLYAGSESGVVSVYDVSGRRLHRTAQAFLHLNAHVVAVDPASHRVYFPLQNVDGEPVMRVMEPQ